MKAINQKCSFGLLILFLIFNAACLKTRTQIRANEGPEEQDTGVPQSGSRASNYDLEAMKSELTRLSGKLEEIEHYQRRMNANEVSETFKKFEGRMKELENNQLLVMSELKGLKDKQTQENKNAATSVNELLAEGFRFFQEKDFEEAAQKFQAILKKSAKSKEAAEAQFGIAEIEYAQKNYSNAILEYAKVEKVFPKSYRISTSLYKIGLSFLHLSRENDAKNFFKELIARYPKSIEAKKARSKVKE